MEEEAKQKGKGRKKKGDRKEKEHVCNEEL